MVEQSRLYGVCDYYDAESLLTEDERRVLSRGEARSLDNQAENLQRRIFRAQRHGVSPYEARSLETQIFNLQRRVAREANDWNRRYGRRH